MPFTCRGSWAKNPPAWDITRAAPLMGEYASTRQRPRGPRVHAKLRVAAATFFPSDDGEMWRHGARRAAKAGNMLRCVKIERTWRKFFAAASASKLRAKHHVLAFAKLYEQLANDQTYTNFFAQSSY